ncbi:unnamed protein product [Phytophthora fragariaefolia]|uniref:Unnamed protein product n=1 Tax=Phytophthora fragariaefolia TaxID=1490495 RepID=A0A9W6XZ41_9STRA|nr:unnamed protein product [Phytophthora fragariaefolia]
MLTVLIVFFFFSVVAAQVEWVWQHPLVSKVTRHKLNFLRGSRGLGAPRSVKRKVLEMLEMVNLEPFKQLNLTVTFTSEEMHNVARAMGARYAAATCETRGLQSFASIEREETSSSTPKCFICEHALYSDEETQSEGGGSESFGQAMGCYHSGCEMCCHSSCLKDHFRSLSEDGDEEENEMKGECPECQQILEWSLLTQHHASEKETSNKRKGTGGRQRDNKRTRVTAVEVNDAGAINTQRAVRSTNTSKTLAQEGEVVSRGDTISIESSSPSSSFSEEYNYENWFEVGEDFECANDASNDHFEVIEEKGAWKERGPQSSFDGEMSPQNRGDVDMIDLTEE